MHFLAGRATSKYGIDSNHRYRRPILSIGSTGDGIRNPNMINNQLLTNPPRLLGMSFCRLVIFLLHYPYYIMCIVKHIHISLSCWWLQPVAINPVVTFFLLITLMNHHWPSATTHEHSQPLHVVNAVLPQPPPTFKMIHEDQLSGLMMAQPIVLVSIG